MRRITEAISFRLENDKELDISFLVTGVGLAKCERQCHIKANGLGSRLHSGTSTRHDRVGQSALFDVYGVEGPCRASSATRALAGSASWVDSKALGRLNAHGFPRHQRAFQSSVGC